MGQKKRCREQAEQNGTERNSKQTKERAILAGLAQLLDLPPDQSPVTVLTKLADQLGCDVAEDGTLSVREEMDDNDEVDEDALPEKVPRVMHVMHGAGARPAAACTLNFLVDRCYMSPCVPVDAEHSAEGRDAEQHL